jgi:hypothetical protein
MTQVLKVSKPGYDAITDNNPDHLYFSSEYNTLKYSATNGGITINIDLQNQGFYREVRQIAHNLGYKPFFKAYIKPSFIPSNGYFPAGFFSIIDSYSNGSFSAYVDDNNIYLVATGRNNDIITTITTPGTPGTPGGLGFSFNGFHLIYDGDYNVGNTVANTGQCTGLANVWCEDWLGLSHIWGDAKDMFGNASSADYDKIPYSAGNVPIVGDMVTFNSNVGGGAGHIGISTGSGNANNFELFSQNDPWGSNCHNVTYGYGNVIGFIRPRNQGSEGTGTPGGTTTVREPHHLQYSVDFKYKIFKNKLNL